MTDQQTKLNDYNQLKLAAQVKTINETNDFRNRLKLVLDEYFASFIGKQVVGEDGELLSSIQLPSLFFSEGFKVESGYKSLGKSHSYTLGWQIVSLKNAYGFSHSQGVVVGNLRDHKFLVDCSPSYEARTDYTVDELTKKDRFPVYFSLRNENDDVFSDFCNDVDEIIHFGLFGFDDDDVELFMTQELVVWRQYICNEFEYTEVGEPEIYGLILNRNGKRIFKLIAEIKEEDSEFY